MTAFFVTCLGVSTWMTVDRVQSALPGPRAGVLLRLLLAWGAGLLAAVVYQLYLWRQGRLIIWSNAERQRYQTQNAARGMRLAPFALTVGLVASSSTLPISGLLGGVLLGFGPTLLWIAFVLRPDEHIGEDLQRGDILGRPRSGRDH